jgi:DNA-binding CsgD family transcriptional regulator
VSTSSGCRQWELEVLRQVATGKSNAELATELYLSEGTVKTHISHILTRAFRCDQGATFALACPGPELPG